MFKRALKAFRRHGFAKFCYLLAYNAGYYLRRIGRRGESDPSGRSLDEALGVETTEIREIGSLDIDSRHAAHAGRYQPSGVDLVRQILRDCGIRYSDFVFIDFGCGKGRVMLLAAEFPFRRILGVEFSRELHEILQKNIAALLGRTNGCRNIQAVLGDAADLELPDDPLVCYFYNPFGEIVMREVVGNIERSLRKSPRDVFVIYVEPLHPHVFDEAHWIVVKRDSRHIIYQSRS
ncbi:MAG TPA: class I SAM-dependent methyltransferase [Burkholderiales bacterium]|nr:class I SAM-dependent methyltransferase [Burkholderiales bacterium]